MENQRQIRFGELIRSLISDCLIKEDFYVHAKGCEEEMAGQSADEFCKNKKEHKCC